MQNLFSYPLIVDELSVGEKKYELKASAEDLEFLKEVLKVQSVKAFRAEFFVQHNKKGHRLSVQGRVWATLELQSVISLENFDEDYENEFSIVYDTKAKLKDLKELEIDFEEEEIDIILDGQIDLVNVAIEQLALVMEDNPRKEGEFFEFQSEFDEEDTKKLNPFSVLEKIQKP